MVTPRLVFVFRGGLPTKLTAPHHQGFIEQAALLEVFQQARNGAIGTACMPGVVELEITMRIPVVIVVSTSGIQLNKTNATFHQPTGHQAFSTKRIGLRLPDPIQIENALTLLTEVYRFRGLTLHAIGELKLIDPRIELGIV